MSEIDEILQAIQPVIDGETDEMDQVVEIMGKVKRCAEALKSAARPEPAQKKRKGPLRRQQAAPSASNGGSVFASDMTAWKKEYAVSCANSFDNLMKDGRIEFSMHMPDWWKCALVVIERAHAAGKHVHFWENAWSGGAIYSGVSVISIVKEEEVERMREDEQQKPNRNVFFFHANDSEEEVERKLTNLANCIMPAKCKHYDLQILQLIMTTIK